MAEIPTFFFSHARQDRETPGNYLRSFFDDLEVKLGQWAGISIKEQRLGTIDMRVPHGENWDENLSRGLRTDNSFVAILTPLYFKRPNCGKELFVFLMRSPGLGIDGNGSLMGVRNVIPIRWLPENAYTANTGKDSLIPNILRLIEDTPGDDGRDDERTQAIERYRKKGMEKCVKHEPHYGELLDLFVESIRDMAMLPPASEASFATAIDAFSYDWLNHFTAAGADVAPPSTSALPAAPVVPTALTSIVAFYVTRCQFTRDPSIVDFADQLIAEALPGMPAPADPVFEALLADVRTAGVAEGFTVFHAASDPVVPIDPAALLSRLTSLSTKRVLTALIVDPHIWLGTSSGAETAAVEQIIRSIEWTGPVLLPSSDASTANVVDLVASRGLPPRIVVLPKSSDSRVVALQRAFIDARGSVLRTSTRQAPDAERLPTLRTVNAESK